MFTVTVLGDKISHDGRTPSGKVIEGSSVRSIEGVPVARLGDRVKCDVHGEQTIVSIPSGMPFTDDLLTSCTTAKTSCGAEVMISEQSLVFQQETSEFSNGEGFSMEMEEMTASERREYLTEQFGGGAAGRAAAQSFERTQDFGGDDPGSEDIGDSNVKSTLVGCGSITNATPDSYDLGGGFTVGGLSSAVYQPGLRHKIPQTTRKGMSRANVICNFRHLVQNTLIPAKRIVESMGYTMKVGSGFRNRSGGSDHNVGSAVDLHIFRNGKRLRNRAEMVKIAKAIYAQTPTTQLLVEWAGGSSAGWVHCANRKSGQKSGLRVGYSLDGRNIKSGWPRY